MMNQMRTGWGGLSLRFLLARPQRAILTALGVALGAALLAAILTTGATLRAVVDDQVRQQFGTWDVMVTAPSATTRTLDPATAAAVSALPEVAYTVPLANRANTAPNSPVEFYIGVGSFPRGQVGLHLAQGREPAPGEAVLPVSVAQRLGAVMGGSFTLPMPSGDAHLRLVGLVPDSGAPPSAYFSYEWLSQELNLPVPPALLIGLRPGVTKATFAERVHALFPDLTLDLRAGLDQARNNLNGFASVAEFLGGGALLAAAFLVLGAFAIAVQQRARELALLRAIGATRQQVARLMLQEATYVGAIGAFGGTGLGVAAAWLCTTAVARYLKLPAHTLVIPIGGVIGVAVAALLLALIGAWPAVLQATRIAPLAAMRRAEQVAPQRERTRGLIGGGLGLGAALLAGASLRPSLSPPVASELSLVAALLLLVAVLVMLPVLVPVLTRVGIALLHRSLPVEATLAGRSIARQRQRAARTAGVLVLGLTVLLTVVSMLATEFKAKELLLHASFPTERQVLAPWGATTGFGADLVQQLRQVPGVVDVVPTGLEIPADLLGYDANRAQAAWLRQQQVAGLPADRVSLQPVNYAALSRIYDFGRVDGQLAGGVVLTRQLAQNMGLRRGETLVLRRLDGGPELRLTITALVEYLPESLVFAVDVDQLQALGVTMPYRVAHVAMARGADPAAVKAAILAVLAGRYASLSYRDVGDFLADLQHRTRENLVIVAAAAIILLVIAGVGLANTVIATLHERSRELAVLRAIGGTPGQVVRAILLEVLLVGLVGSLLGVGTGALVSGAIMLPGLPAGAPFALPLVPMAVGLGAGPVLAVFVAHGKVRAVAHAPLARALQVE